MHRRDNTEHVDQDTERNKLIKQEHCPTTEILTKQQNNYQNELKETNTNRYNKAHVNK